MWERAIREGCHRGRVSGECYRTRRRSAGEAVLQCRAGDRDDSAECPRRRVPLEHAITGPRASPKRRSSRFSGRSRDARIRRSSNARRAALIGIWEAPVLPAQRLKPRRCPNSCVLEPRGGRFQPRPGSAVPPPDCTNRDAESARPRTRETGGPEGHLGSAVPPLAIEALGSRPRVPQAPNDGYGRGKSVSKCPRTAGILTWGIAPKCRSGMLPFASTSSMSHADASAPTDGSGAPRCGAPAVAQGLAPFHARQAGGAPNGARQARARLTRGAP